MTWEDLRDYIGAMDSDQQELTRCLAVAKALIDEFIEGAYKEVPEEIYNQCHLDVATSVWSRKSQPNGQFAVPDGPVPVRAPNEPLQQVMPILRRYVLPL